VVITIIGILMALLFPALNAARESARRGQCINNAKQIALAVEVQTLEKGKFPKHLGNFTDQQTTPVTHTWPWIARVMRELGRGDIADALAANGTLADRTERVDLLICPSDPPINQTDKQTSYACNSGVAGLDDSPNQGVFHQTKDVTPSFIAQNDGTATTVMFAENVNATYWTDADTASDSVYQQALIWDPATAGLNKDKEPATLSAMHARPSSKHSGGFVVAFCDAHVEFISEEISYETYKKIMTPKGGPLGQTPLSEVEFRK
ncbi:MAG: DUF1559 domain-containing protein, partial [Planctomycetales bacterium]|nr:DUF1559 domain-containing protein [Planctomycetales bacterium]